MIYTADHTLQDSVYGMVFRVSVGAALSMTDAATDIYVITTYYESEELFYQANAMLTMVTLNLFNQLMVSFVKYRKKSLAVKAKEALITLFFLRPAFDAYRLSKNHDDMEIDPLVEVSENYLLNL